MNDSELRALVRDAVARHLGRAAAPPMAAPVPSRALEFPQHASHDVYITLVNTTEACVIEPDVACTHCNYCKSHGH